MNGENKLFDLKDLKSESFDSTLTITISKEKFERLKKIAREKKISVSKLNRYLIDKFLEYEEKSGQK